MQTTDLTRFNGLNNVADPMRGTDAGTKQAQTWEWLSVADNVDVTDSGGVCVRDGWQSFSPGTRITAAYATEDTAKLYLIDNGVLVQVFTDATRADLLTGLDDVAHWAETNNAVYLSCGTQKLEIMQDGSVRSWGIQNLAVPAISAGSGVLPAGVYRVCLTCVDAYGREGGSAEFAEISIPADSTVVIHGVAAPAGHTVNLYVTEADGAVFYRAASVVSGTVSIGAPASGAELLTLNMFPPPQNAEQVTFFKGRMYLAEYMPAEDQTVIWYSQPLGYHLFALDTDYFVLPGRVTQMGDAQEALIVATNHNIWAYNPEQLQHIVYYGCPGGQHAVQDGGKLYLWTNRGLCRALPFENLTEAAVSVPPGLQAGGCVVDKNGFKKYVTLITPGGDAYNQRS